VTTPPTWEPTAEEELDEREFQRLYGPWEAYDRGQVAGLLAGFDRPWWLVGGWSIEAFTGVPRRHEDIDVVVFRRDLPRLQGLLGDRFHFWSVGAGALRPLTTEWPEPHADAGQVWLREHALAPWRLDVILSHDHQGEWVSRREPDRHAPLDDVTWVGDDGIRYLNPEIVLQHKARLDRPKDRVDLAVAWPRLAAEQRDWLRDGVRRLHPEHAWLDRMI
jgi:Aminoglycoside-2''-adenylyltransferase